MKKVILCPNPYRDKGLAAAKEAEGILRSVGLETVYCLPFKPEGGEGQFGVACRPLQQELRGSDLFHQNWNGVTVYFDRFVGWERDKYDTREFALTVRYKFNASKSRYKGTGAGQDALNRL